MRTTHEQLFFCIDIGTLNVYPNWLAFWIIYSTSAVTKLVKSDMRSSWRVPARNNVPSFRPLRILQNELGYCFWHSARQQGALLELYMLNVLAMPLIFDRSQGVILILLHKVCITQVERRWIKQRQCYEAKGWCCCCYCCYFFLLVLWLLLLLFLLLIYCC